MQFLFKLTLLFGLVCTGYSGYRFVYFFRSTHLAGKAVMWMIGGEFVGLTIYCMFATLEIVGINPDPLVSTALRNVVFGTALAASIHMSGAIRKIGNDDHHSRTNR